jgi:hypothetical protein
VGHEDAAPGALGGADQVAAGEELESLPESRAADAELRREVLLAAEEITRTETLLLDVVLDLNGDLL